MKKEFKKLNNQEGVIAILALFGISIVGLSIASTLVSLSINEMKMSYNNGALDQTFYAAEAGINEALYKLGKDSLVSGLVSDMDFGGNNVKVYVDISGKNRDILSIAENANGQKRILKITATTNNFGIGFDHAIKGGSGGIEIGNNAEIQGSVFSNGYIKGQNMNSSIVNGDVWISENNILENIRVNGNAEAYQIKDSFINGDAKYSLISNSTVAGNSVNVNPNLSSEELCMTDEIIDEMIDHIISLGNPEISTNPAECPNSNPYKNGSYYCISSDSTISNQKINGGLYINSGSEPVFNGAIHVTGDIVFENNSTIKIGGDNVFLISDGTININNNANVFNEDGGDDNYIVMISRFNNLSNPTPYAISANNNSSSIIFVTLNGTLEVKNNGQINAACAHKVYVRQNSKIIYNSNFDAFNIGEVADEEITAKFDSWQEL